MKDFHICLTFLRHFKFKSDEASDEIQLRGKFGVDEILSSSLFYHKSMWDSVNITPEPWR